MAVQHEIKSNLAKLLATEDLVVEHKQVPTAQFNVHTRVLTLPLWEKASNDVYDMLVGHEVAHALFTPDQDPPDDIPHQIVNVVEDARIEKLMKRKYMGIAKSFYRGYSELHGQDFFELDGEDIDTFNLADRANLYFKVGSFLDLAFSDTEKEIIGLIEKAETFKDTEEVARVLYDYCVGQQEEQEKKVADIDAHMKGTQQELNFGVGEKETEEEKLEESEGESQQSSQMEGSTESQPSTDFPDELEVRTAESLEDKLQDLVNSDGQDNVYVQVPEVDLDTIIASNQDVHRVIDESFDAQQVGRDNRGDEIVFMPKNLYEEIDSEFVQFKRDAQKEVNYLVKEFECKKAASAYARATTARTGVIDTSKLHTYKYNEDLFKKITSLPDGKNHGLVFILDWSGSMQHVLEDTLKQLYNLIWFCKKVHIPFEVYAFSNEWRLRDTDYTYRHQLKPHYEAKEGLMCVGEEFSLMNLLTSKVNVKELEHQMINIWRLANAFSNRYQCYYRYPEALVLSGTPLNESLVALYQILPKFQKENNVEKVQCIVLTDGEANYLPYHKRIQRHWEDDDFLGSRHVNPQTCFLRDRMVGKTYKFQYGYHQFTSTLLENLKDRFPSVNFIGIRVLANKEGLRFAKMYYPEGCSQYQKIERDWRKTKSYTLKEAGYDAYFVMSSNTLAQDDEFEVAENATKGQIKKAFVKSLKVKKLNKKVLGEFISLVA